ncbi:tetratricopeptide repeat protein [Parvularcula sp. IMCC14364]|uniref:tetratricopeptide repeat protein n=1 Tax=Parvularcula sp. IMCC14364 TaxID=3067902 RepID=UPI002740AD33|nr:tetratricopeptide repeat protein [Parvularcula sp. IMCC14364]
MMTSVFLFCLPAFAAPSHAQSNSDYPAAAFAAGRKAFAEERFAEAYRLFEEACAGGQPGGCFNFALMVDYGIATNPDPTRARAYYRQACDGEIPSGCRYLGARLRENEPKDPELAVYYFETSCQLGDAEGCFLAGYLHRRGEGTYQDEGAALDFFIKACERNYQLACDELGPRLR